MKYKAFLLGLFSITAQVFMLRELMASYGGSELYIGTALFGWMISVALGALYGGRKNINISSIVLFIGSAILIPVMLLAVRFSPFIFSDIVGETIPFTKAAPLSVALMFPPGFIFGWLFPVINREGYKPSEAIIHTYLYEGLGAFAGGLILMFAIGTIFSTFSLALALSLLIILGQIPTQKKPTLIIAAIIFIAGAAALALSTDKIETSIDSHKYTGYDIFSSFDTHYGHQSILSKDSSLILMTDNFVEATLPNKEASEYDIIPPLLYRPQSTDLLYIGRAEFGAAQLAERFPNLAIRDLDSRKNLDSKLAKLINPGTSVTRIDTDPVSFMREAVQVKRFDAVIMHVGEPSSFATANLYGTGFFVSIRNVLKPGGLLYIPTSYDTDRYILPEKQKIISTIYAGLKKSFKHVTVWPGQNTLFFASDDSILNIAPSDIISRLDSLPYTPTYIDSYFLQDRLNDFKISRLHSALNNPSQPQTVQHPILPIYETMFQSRAHGSDDRIIPLLLDNPYTASVVGIIILALFCMTVFNTHRTRMYGLFFVLCGRVCLVAAGAGRILYLSIDVGIALFGHGDIDRCFHARPGRRDVLFRPHRHTQHRNTRHPHAPDRHRHLYGDLAENRPSHLFDLQRAVYRDSGARHRDDFCRGDTAFLFRTGLRQPGRGICT